MSKPKKSETPVAVATACSQLITQAELENVLTHEGIVEHDAIEDPFGYDNGKTELAVSVAARVLDEIARHKTAHLVEALEAAVEAAFREIAAAAFSENDQVEARR